MPVSPFATRAELEAALARHSFYHSIEVAPGLTTAGDPQQVPPQRLVLRAFDSVSFEGKRVLDVGCRDGLFCFEAERRKACEVIGIDNNLSHGATEVLIPHLRSGVRMVEMNLLDLRAETFGRFDVIIFAGVLYHMRFPFRALKILREVINEGGRMVLETAVLDGFDAYPLLYYAANDEGPYESTSPTFFNRKCLTDTLGALGFSVLSLESLWARTPAWLFLLRYLLRRRILKRRRRPGLPDPLPVNRVVTVCSALPQRAPSFIDGYFEGTHDYHSRAQKEPAAPRETSLSVAGSLTLSRVME